MSLCPLCVSPRENTATLRLLFYTAGHPLGSERLNLHRPSSGREGAAGDVKRTQASYLSESNGIVLNYYFGKSESRPLE